MAQGSRTLIPIEEWGKTPVPGAPVAQAPTEIPSDEEEPTLEEVSAYALASIAKTLTEILVELKRLK